MGAPIQISATWFPPHERTRATSIGQMFNALGVGVSFFLANVIVRFSRPLAINLSMQPLGRAQTPLMPSLSC